MMSDTTNAPIEFDIFQDTTFIDECDGKETNILHKIPISQSKWYKCSSFVKWCIIVQNIVRNMIGIDIIITIFVKYLVSSNDC